MLKDLSINEFVQELSSKAPTPGGGSGAALSAALSASLSAMVFNLTVGKKSFLQLEEEIKRQIDEALTGCVNMRENFIQLMEKDAEAFTELMSYFKLPKETEEEKEYRKQKINEGYISAMKVPFELAQMSLKLYDYILIAAKYGNINAISDAGVSALLNQATLESAVLNVKINLSSIEDKGFIEEKMLVCSQMVEEGYSKKSEIMDIVNSKI